VPERGYSQSQLERNLLDTAVDVKTKMQPVLSVIEFTQRWRSKNRLQTGRMHESARIGMVFTN
jgi:hypothetical protein